MINEGRGREERQNKTSSDIQHKSLNSRNLYLAEKNILRNFEPNESNKFIIHKKIIKKEISQDISSIKREE